MNYESADDAAPVKDQPWVKRALNGDFAAESAFDADIPMDWAVDGWIPRKGASVWFGPGATGKTQLLLWMALSVAATGQAKPTHWLGGGIQRRGHILLLSAEDADEHILMRLGSLSRAMFPDSASTAREACSRIHVMSFLSMTETEFPHDAPTLFAKGTAGPGWRPHQRLEGIRYFIEEHNRRVHEKKGPDEDRIVGVLMDSATSMAGFETTDSGGATSLLFYLNRMCRALDVFWAIIGHTQKQPEIDAARPRANSVARLRGSAMWSTAPRMVVEVRLACDVKPKSGSKESDLVKRVKPGVAARDILVVDVAKANVPVLNPEPRYLVREDGAILVDVSDEVAKADTGRPAQDVTVKNDPPVTRRQSEDELEERRLFAVMDLIRQVFGSEPGTRVVRARLDDSLAELSSKIEFLDSVTPTRGSDDEPRPKALNLYLNRLVERGALKREGGKKLLIVNLDASDLCQMSEAA